MCFEIGVITPFIANRAAFPIRMKPVSQSKRERLRRPAKVQFAMTGVLVGVVVGIIAGVVAESVLGRGMIVMQAGAVAGLVVGYLVETVRFWWRKRKSRTLHLQ